MFRRLDLLEPGTVVYINGYGPHAVCDYAMRKKPKNITAVPEAMITREMAEAVIRNGRGDFDILAFIPERLWDAQLTYLA